MMSAKEITSNSSVTTTLLEKFYGEMVCTWTLTVRIYSSVTFLTETNGGGVLIYIREDIPSKLLAHNKLTTWH